jgi:hypothetical protein
VVVPSRHHLSRSNAFAFAFAVTEPERESPAVIGFDEDADRPTYMDVDEDDEATEPWGPSGEPFEVPDDGDDDDEED